MAVFTGEAFFGTFAGEAVANSMEKSERDFLLVHLLTQPQLTTIRAALSEPFNDFPVEYDFIADKVRGIDPDVLYEILYSEVAPVCFTNLVAAVPPVWTGFDPEALRESIEERLAAREHSWFRRQFDKVLVCWLEYNYAYIWREIASRL